MKQIGSNLTALCLVVVAVGGTARAGAIEEWMVEAGSLAGHHDNFFYRGEGQPAPGEDLYSLYSLGEMEVDGGKGDFLFSYSAAAFMTTEIEGSDYQDYGIEAGYKILSTRIMAEYGYTPNRVYFEESLAGESVFFDLQRRALEIRQGIISGLWIGAEYEYESWAFDPAEEERDAKVTGLSGTVRVPLGGHVGLRGTVFKESKEAGLPDYDWEGQGYAVALEVNPLERLSLYIRYKHRDRDYEDAPVTDSNFEREDDTQDWLLSLRWRIGRHWGFRLEDFYRDGESSRADRNYDGNRLTGGFFMVFDSSGRSG